MNKMPISFCICVWNESKELDLLLKRLIPNLQDVDEIVIQGDQGKVTDEVISIVRTVMKDPRIKYLEFPLKKDFAAFKNNAIKNCSGDYIVLLDPDEIPHPRLLANLKYLLFENREVDLFRLPRVNVVIGVTNEYVQEHRWNLVEIEIPKLDYDSKNILTLYGIKEKKDQLKVKVVNPFDWQERIIKNNKKIFYEGIVHEKFKGHSIETNLPVQLENFNELDLTWCLFHIKMLNRQKKQNEFYEQIMKEHNVRKKEDYHPN